MTQIKQTENLMISTIRSNNFTKLTLELAGKSSNKEMILLNYIYKFMSNIRVLVSKDPLVRNNVEVLPHVKDTFYDHEEARKFRDENLINLTPEFIYKSGAHNRTKGPKNKDNYRARKVARNLVKHNLLVKVKSSLYKDLYRINPLYIYWGTTFGDCYISYQEATGHTVDQDDPILSKVYYSVDKWGKKIPAVNPIIRENIDTQLEDTINGLDSTNNNSTSSPTISINSAPTIIPDTADAHIDPAGDSNTLDNSTDQQEQEYLPTGAFNDYMYSTPREQCTSPYNNTYMCLLDQYNNEKRNISYELLDPLPPTTPTNATSAPQTKKTTATKALTMATLIAQANNIVPTTKSTKSKPIVRTIRLSDLLSQATVDTNVAKCLKKENLNTYIPSDEQLPF